MTLEPAQALRYLACDAQILPAIFSGGSVPLDLGRARRKASPAQRAALIARDKHYIGCGDKASWCQSHHIIHWADGGPTNIDNMCLLCSRCHQKVHDQDRTVHKPRPGDTPSDPHPPNGDDRPANLTATAADAPTDVQSNSENENNRSHQRCQTCKQSNP